MWNISDEPEGAAEKCKLFHHINYQLLCIHMTHTYFEFASDNCSGLQIRKKKCIETNDTESLI